jgi:glycosyltransferase involved in cell wall biosynthesis
VTARLSIITPVLNGERYIAGCVENVASQNVAGIEHIVVDGGSTDSTLAVVAALKARYPHLRLIPGPDKGQSDAMNKGIRAAAAPVIGILNNDDFYQENALADALSVLEGLPRPSFVVGNTRVINEAGKTVYWNRPWDLRLESLVLGWWYTSPPMNPSAYFYHKRVHDEVGFYDLEHHYAMDQAFILECARCGIGMIYVDRHWGNFRLTPGTKTYDDEHSGNAIPRMRALYKSYVSDFTWKQRLKMYSILLTKIPRRLGWVLLHRFGLR